MTMDENIVTLLLNDMWTIHLTIVGIMVSVITLLYSLALGKAGEMKAQVDNIKHGSKDPLIIAQKNFSIKYIKETKKTICACIIILSCSIFNTALCWAGWRFFNMVIKTYILYVTLAVSLIIVMTFVYSIIRLAKQYHKDIVI